MDSSAQSVEEINEEFSQGILFSGETITLCSLNMLAVSQKLSVIIFVWLMMSID